MTRLLPLLVAPQLAVSCLPSRASTLTVTSNADDGSSGTLRSRIAAAAPGDTIDFAVTGTIVLVQGQILLDKDLTIQGPDADLLVIDGNRQNRFGERIFATAPGVRIVLSQLDLRNAGAYAFEEDIDGGCILNEGELTLRQVKLEECWASRGAAIYNALGASVEIYDSLLTENNVAYQGGGIFNSGYAGLIRTQILATAVLESYDGFTVYNDGTMRLQEATLSGGTIGGWAVHNLGSLTAVSTTFYQSCNIRNEGTAALIASEVDFGSNPCGALEDKISNSGIMRFVASTLTGGDNLGAGLENSGMLTVDRSTIRDNRGASWAGIRTTGTVIVVNSTISGNTSTDYGAPASSGVAVQPGGQAFIYNSTLVSPTLSNGIYGPDNDPPLSGGEITLRNTIVARSNLDFPCVTPPDESCKITCATTGIDSLGGNISSHSSCNDQAVQGSFLTQSPDLGPLQDNGGPTWTHALLAGSPAIDYGMTCTWDDDLDPKTPEVPLLSDQRGWLRPARSACDSGAYEFGSAPLPRVVGHRVLDCTAHEEIATLASGEPFSVDLAHVAQPACLGVGVRIEANATSGDGSVGHDYTPAYGEAVTSPYEGESYEPFAMMGDYGWVVPGEIAACECDNPERGDLTWPGIHTITSTPCSADVVSWTSGDKAAQCEAAGGLAGVPFTTSLEVVPEPSTPPLLGSGLLLLGYLNRRRGRKRLR